MDLLKWLRPADPRPSKPLHEWTNAELEEVLGAHEVYAPEYLTYICAEVLRRNLNK